MTIQDWPGGLYYPDHSGDPTPSAVRHILDADGEKCALIFQCPKDGTLTDVVFRTSVVAQDTNGLKISFQTVDVTTGLPDGVVDQSVVQAVASNTWYEVTMGASRVVTAGEVLAVVIEFDSWAGSDDVDISALTHSYNEWHDSNSIYGAFHNATSWAVSTMNMALGLKYSDASYESFGPASGTLTAAGALTFNSGDTPDEYGNVITLPSPARCCGIWASVDADNDFDLVLYDSDGSTVLGTTSFDKDIKYGSSYGVLLARFDPVDLAKDTEYRMAIKPGASDIRIMRYFMYAQNTTPGGASCHLTSQTGGGGWSETSTERIVMGLLLTGFDDGVGGGAASGARNPLGGPIG